jgi:hypothetical protein
LLPKWLSQERILAIPLRRLQDWGAEQAMLMTMGTNMTAQQAFKSVGFLPVEQGFVYKKQVEPR